MNGIIPLALSGAALMLCLFTIRNMRITRLLNVFTEANWALVAANQALGRAYRTGADPAAAKAQVEEAKAAVARARARLPERVAEDITRKARKP